MTGDAVHRTTKTNCLPIEMRSLPSSAVTLLVLDHLFHEADVVELGQIPVLEKVRTFMLRHCLDQMFDDFVWNERMSEVELGNIWLSIVLAGKNK